MAIQNRRGYEADFDPAKMLPGEWAVSIDTKYVRMCFGAGVCLRMATYEAFEQDMEEIMRILAECRDIKTAVELIRDKVTDAELVIEDYVAQAKQYRDEAEQFRNEVEAIVNVDIATTEKAGIVKPDGTTIRVDADGTIHADNGTVDYNELENKPQINGVELSGDKSLSEFGIASNEDVSKLNTKVDTIIDKAELNIKNTASGETIHATDSADSKVVAFGLYGKAEQSGTPTPDAPVDIEVAGESGSIEVKSVGKNAIGYENLENKNEVAYENGVYTITQAPTESYRLWEGVFEENTQYTFSGLHKQGKTQEEVNGLRVVYTDGTYKNMPSAKTTTYANFTFTSEEGKTIDYIRNLYQGGVLIVEDFQCEKGTQATEYQPYTESTSLISTPDGLASVGGVYDEIIKYADGSGKRIQRIGKFVLNGSEEYTQSSHTDENRLCVFTKQTTVAPKLKSVLCDKFIAGDYVKEKTVNIINSNMQHINIGVSKTIASTVDEFRTWLSNNNVTAYIELATPIITDLTAEEIAEIEKLHTFYPVTNISNDADCNMAVKYLADAKNYIDQRLALIETAMLNNI